MTRARKIRYSVTDLAELNMAQYLLQQGLKEEVHILECSISESRRQLWPKSFGKDVVVTIEGHFRVGRSGSPLAKFGSAPRRSIKPKTFKAEFTKSRDGRAFVYSGQWLWIDGKRAS